MSARPKASPFGKRYPTPAYCGQCNQVLDGWFEVTVGMGELSQRRWQCPRCDMKVPDELMRQDNPHEKRRPASQPDEQQITSWLEDKANPDKKEKTDVTAIVVHDESKAELTDNEVEELEKLETTIQAGLQSFFEVGNALLEIRDRRLYRETYKTFEDYCNGRWNFSRQRASQLIQASSITQSLSTHVDILPETEAQARPLTQLTPERRAEVWQRAVATAPDGQVTLKHVQQVVDEALGKTGRFENKLFYPVNARDRIIYDSPRDTGATYGEKPGPLSGASWMQGKVLNNEKQYDGFQLAPVPDYTPLHDLKESLKAPNDWAEFPVDQNKHLIYNDPSAFSRKPGYYKGCSWVPFRTIRDYWGSVIYRWGDFDVVPAKTPPTAWLAEAKFKPDMQAKCDECSRWGTETVYPYDKWKIDAEGIWICPHGHRKADNLMSIFKQDALPGIQPSAPEEEAEEDEDEAPEEDSPLTSEMQDVLDCVETFMELVGYIRSNRALVESALQPDVLEAYAQFAWTTDITTEALADLKRLIACFAPDAGESETEEA